MIWVRISYERQRNPQCITTTAKNNTLAQIRIRITCYINHLLNFLPCLLTVACCFLAFFAILKYHTVVSAETCYYRYGWSHAVLQFWRRRSCGYCLWRYQCAAVVGGPIDRLCLRMLARHETSLLAEDVIISQLHTPSMTLP